MSPYAPGTVFCGLARAFFDHNGVQDSVTIKGFDVRVASLGPDNIPTDSTIVDFILPN